MTFTKDGNKSRISFIKYEAGNDIALTILGTNGVICVIRHPSFPVCAVAFAGGFDCYVHTDSRVVAQAAFAGLKPTTPAQLVPKSRLLASCASQQAPGHVRLENADR